MKYKFIFILLIFASFYDVFADGCTTIQFTADPTPNSYCSYDFLATTVENTDCDYSQPYTYYWDFDDGSALVYDNLAPTHIYTTSGVYDVTLTFEGICHGSLTTCSQTIPITINIPPAPEIFVTTSEYDIDSQIFNVSCNGGSNGSINLSSSGPYTFNWQTNPPQIGSSINNLSAGDYEVIGVLDGCPAQTLEITLIEPDEVLISPVIENPSCKNYEDGYIEPNVSGGMPPYNFLWNNGSTFENIYNLNDETYELQVIDQTTCVTTFEFDLTDPSPLVPSLTSISDYNGYNISCYGEDDGFINITTVGSHPPYSFSWSNGATTEDLTNIESGVYFLYVSDQNQCDTTISVSLNQPNVLSSTISSTTNYNGYDISCNGLFDGAIDFEIEGSLPPYSYFWDGGQTTQDISNVGGGLHTINVVDFNGCSHTNSIFLNEPSPLVASIQSANDYNGFEISCIGYSDGDINLTMTGSVPPYDYVWDNGSTSQDLANVVAGFYSVQITDDNNCTTNQDITLTEPTSFNSNYTTSDYNGFNVSCYNNNDGYVDYTLGGSVPPYSYNWSGPSGYQSLVEDNFNLYDGTYNLQVLDANNCIHTDLIILDEPTDFSSSIISTSDYNGYDVSCNGFFDGSIDFEISGSLPPYSYIWDNGQTTQDISNVGADLHTINVIDFNGCSHTRSIVLNEPSPFVGSIQSANDYNGFEISCIGYSDGDINLTMAGSVPPYDYVWDNGSTSQDLANVVAGFYSVQITDDNNCTTYQDITLTEPTSFNSIYTTSDYNGFNVSCHNNNDGFIDYTLGGSVPPYSYNWSGPGGYQSLVEDNFNLIDGTYDLQVLDANNCLHTDLIILDEPTDFSSSIISTTNYNGYDVSCNGFFDGSIDFEIEGSVPPYSYSWDSGQTTQDVNNINAGLHTVDVVDINGCTHTNSIVLNEPTPLVGTILSSNNYNGFDISCTGYIDGGINVTVSGSVPPYDYVWNNSATSQNIANVTAGYYNVQITDDNNCILIQDITLTEPIDFSSTYTASDFNGYNISCYGFSDGLIDYSLGGSVPPYTFNWTGPSGFESSTEDNANLFDGTYYLQVFDANNCLFSETIILNEPSELSYDLITKPDTCFRNVGFSSVSVSGGNPSYNYYWNNVITSQNFYENLDAGDHSILIQDLNGCEELVDFNISNMVAPVADFILDPNEYRLTEQLGSGIYLFDNSTDEWSNVIDWQWNTGDNTFYSTQDIIHRYDSIGDYTITLIIENEHECFDTISKSVSIKDYLIYIPNAFSPRGKNPVFRPKGIGISEYNLQIYNRWNQLVFESNDFTIGWDGTYKSNDVQIGVYKYKIELTDVFLDKHLYLGEIHLIE